jgi:hypothetical protein
MRKVCVVAALALAVAAGVVTWRRTADVRQEGPVTAVSDPSQDAGPGASPEAPAEAVPAGFEDKPGDDASPVAAEAAAAGALDEEAPFERRLAAVEALASHHGGTAARTLMELAAQEGPLRTPAIEALGQLPPDARVALQLRMLLAVPDPHALAAAVRSLGRQEGAAAVTAIGETLQHNRRRPDGYEDTVCGACVETLGAIKSPAAVPILVDELEANVGRELQFDYGSQVVAALRSIGHSSARPALAAYRDRLRSEQAAQGGNPLGLHYLAQKIDEADAALDSMR